MICVFLHLAASLPLQKTATRNPKKQRASTPFWAPRGATSLVLAVCHWNLPCAGGRLQGRHSVPFERRSRVFLGPTRRLVVFCLAILGWLFNIFVVLVPLLLYLFWRSFLMGLFFGGSSQANPRHCSSMPATSYINLIPSTTSTATKWSLKHHVIVFACVSTCHKSTMFANSFYFILCHHLQSVLITNYPLNYCTNGKRIVMYIDHVIIWFDSPRQVKVGNNVTLHEERASARANLSG